MKSIATTAMLLVALAATACAQPQAATQAAAPGADRIPRGLAQLDGDGDRAIDRAEFDAWRGQMFKQLDGDGDGALSAEEMQAHRAGQGHGPAAGRFGAMKEHARTHRQAIFSKLDADGDRKVTEAEFLAAAGERFKSMDRDADGSLSEGEAAPPRQGRPGSAARKGGHGEAEHRRIALDADNDGRITAAEFQAAGAERFNAMDRDGDGKLAATEFRRRHGR